MKKRYVAFIPSSTTPFLQFRIFQEVCKQISQGYNDISNDIGIINQIVWGAQVYYNHTGKTVCLNLDDTDDIGAGMWDYQVTIMTPREKLKKLFSPCLCLICDVFEYI